MIQFLKKADRQLKNDKKDNFIKYLVPEEVLLEFELRESRAGVRNFQ